MSLMGQLLDFKDLNKRQRFLIKLFHQLYKNGQLVIPDNLIRAVVITEGYICDTNYTHGSLERVTEIDAKFIERFNRSK